LPLEAVAKNISEHLAKEKATAELKGKADKLIAGLRDGSIKAASQNWKVRKPLPVARTASTLPSCRRCSAWASRRQGQPVYGSVVLGDGSLVVLQLKGVNEGAAATDEEKAQIRRYLASRAGSQDFAAYRNGWKAVPTSLATE
jgi:peptidyl-prolyl cis-trans isomerase D